MNHYILGGPDGHTPLVIDTSTTEGLIRWGKALESVDQKIVQQTERNGILVSTVFLGMDHSFNGDDAQPVVFETMVFKGGGGQDHDAERYRTWDEAVIGHWNMVRKWIPDPIEEAARIARETA